MLSLDVKAIGVIQDLGAGRARLAVMPAYRAGLVGLQPGCRAQVLYWMHELAHADRSALQVHPGGDERRPRQGVFSLRSCTRPNPIGVTEVDVVEVSATGVVVVGLDARDGAPLIDLKAACR